MAVQLPAHIWPQMQSNIAYLMKEPKPFQNKHTEVCSSLENRKYVEHTEACQNIKQRSNRNHTGRVSRQTTGSAKTKRMEGGSASKRFKQPVKCRKPR